MFPIKLNLHFLSKTQQQVNRRNKWIAGLSRGKQNAQCSEWNKLILTLSKCKKYNDRNSVRNWVNLLTTRLPMIFSYCNNPISVKTTALPSTILFSTNIIFILKNKSVFGKYFWGQKSHKNWKKEMPLKFFSTFYQFFFVGKQNKLYLTLF